MTASPNATVPPFHDRTWLEHGAARVIEGAHAAILRHSSGSLQHRVLAGILHDGLASGRGAPADGRCSLAARLPLLIHLALAGDPAPPAYDLAAAITLLEAGIYALDHAIDREIEGALALFLPDVVLLGGLCLVSHVPYQVIAASQDGVTAFDLMRMLADGLARVAAGQIQDVSLGLDGTAQPAETASAVAMKTGERRALYAALAARQAGAAMAQVEECAAFGRALGIARQLRSDLVDLFGPQPSRDLASQTLTLPLALYFERGGAEEVRAMRALLADGSQPERTQREVRERVKRAGILREVVVLIEAQCARALAAVDALERVAGAGSMLRDLVRDASLASAS